MGTAALDFYPPTTPFPRRTFSKIHLRSSTLYTLVLRDSQWHLVSDSANQSKDQNTSRAIKSYTCVRTSPFDFWMFHWSELFTGFLLISVCNREGTGVWTPP